MVLGNRGLSTLIAGLVLIAVGALFLVVNLTSFEVDWITLLKLVLPALFVFAGALKLYRHYVWSDEELLARPGKAGLLSGLFWLSIGTLLLLDIFEVVETLQIFGLYWPVIIIVFGVGKIIDYYRLGGRLQVRTGEIFGLVFIIVFGFACNQLADAHFRLFEDLGWSMNWPEVELGSEKFEFETTQSSELEGIEIVEVRNAYGDLRVEAGSDLLQVDLDKVIGAENEEEATQLSEAVALIIRREEARLIIQTNREELGDRGKRLTTNLTLAFPLELPVAIKNGFGEVTVKAREGDCEIENSYGLVQVEELGGSVSIVNEYAPVDVRNVGGTLNVTNRRGPVSAQGVSGNLQVVTDHADLVIRDAGGQVKVENEYGDVSITGVALQVEVIALGSSVAISKVMGPVSVRTSHRDVRIEELRADLDLETSYSEVSLKQISGFVRLIAMQSEVEGEEFGAGASIQGKGSAIALAQTRGKVTIETSLRRVSMREFSGPVEVQNEFAEIFLEPASPLKSSILAVNKNGGITVSLDESASFDLSAQAADGEISSDFESATATPDTDGQMAYLDMEIGSGGPTVELQTTYSRISIKKRG